MITSKQTMADYVKLNDTVTFVSCIFDLFWIMHPTTFLGALSKRDILLFRIAMFTIKEALQVLVAVTFMPPKLGI